MMCIYQIKNLVNGKVYIGSSCSFKRRRWQHISHLKKNKHHSVHLQRAWNKDGSENFKFEILEIVLESKETLFEIEQRYLDLIKPYNFKIGYNTSTDAVSGLKGKHHTEEVKKKIGEASRARPRTEENNRHISESHMGHKNPMYGTHLSDEAKQVLRNFSKGKSLKERGHKDNCQCRVCIRVRKAVKE